MKLQDRDTTYETTFGGETTDFQIKVTGKAFDTLLSGLYSNKIRAMIRELWTNAFDSHIAAGIPSTPFDVHLPTRFEPVFRVRDYGVSLSHEDVIGLYSTLFDSTKDDTNDMVGALGLGSKSPFAYTDQFTVIARLNGRKRTYLAARQGDGTPGITLVSDEESDEAQGLEISVACRNDDFGQFEQEARSLAIGFDPMPDVDGVEIETVDPVYVDEEGGFAIFTKEIVPGSESLAIRQGCVIYPVDDYNLTRKVREFMKWTHALVIDVPIGAVSFTAGRESLSLDDHTIKNVEAAIETTLAKLKADIDARTAECKNRLEALEFWFGGEGDGGDSITATTNLQPTYRGERLDSWIELKVNGGDGLVARQGNSRKTIELRRLRFQSRDEYRFVIQRSNEKVIRGTLRYREVVEEHGKDRTFLLRDPSKRQIERLVRLSGLRPDQVISLASLPDPGAPVRGKRGSGTLAGVNEITSMWNKSAVTELPTDFYWFEVHRITKGDVQSIFSRAESAFNAGVLPRKPILAFSEKALERHAPGSAKCFRIALEKVVEAGREDHKAAAVATNFNAAIANAGLEDVVAPMPTVTCNHNLSRFNVMRPKDESEVERAVKARLSLIKDRYPLLLTESRYGGYTRVSAEKADIEWYIKARDGEFTTTLSEDLKKV